MLEASTSEAIYCELGPRTQLSLIGADRHSFLHSFCTNDVKKLQPGQGCEAFITNAQGKLLGFVYVFVETDRLWIDTEPGLGPSLIAHLDRYVIREKVSFEDHSQERVEFVLGGKSMPRRLEELCGGCPSAQMEQTEWRFGGHTLLVRRVDYWGAPSFFVSTPNTSSEPLRETFSSHGFEAIDATHCEYLRVLAGTPRYGIDMTAENLPQEVGRDSTAISFSKGCYLGQETVARIDALGHVNWNLTRMRFEGRSPPSGAEIAQDGKNVLRITSSCEPDISRGRPGIALGYLRRGYPIPNSRLEWEGGLVTILPST